MAERQAHRLPTDVIPSRYQIRLTPDLTTWTFTGEESVAVAIERPVREITVNAAELSIQSVTLLDGAGKIHNGDVTLDPDNEQARFGFGIAAAPGPATLKIQFSGILNDKLHGFYRSTYKSADGRDRPLASTQFESTDARRAFPCWDEPVFKAVYQVTLVVDATLTAISNARVIS